MAAALMIRLDAAIPLPLRIVAISREARRAMPTHTGRIAAPADQVMRPVQYSHCGSGVPSIHSSRAKTPRTKRIRMGPITRRLRTSLFRFDSAESASSPCIVTDGGMKLLCSEVGPVDAGDMEFGITDLPQKIVAHPQFAR